MARSNLVGYTYPSIDEIQENIFANIDNELPNNVARVRYSGLNVFTLAFSNALYNLYQKTADVSNQQNLLYCDGSNLDMWGDFYSTPRKLPTHSVVTLSTSTNTVNVTIPANTNFTINGMLFSNLSAASITASTLSSFEVISLDVGSKTMVPVAVSATLQNSITNVNGTFSVTAISANGEDIETDFTYRNRLLDRYRNPTNGSNKATILAQMKKLHPKGFRFWVLENNPTAGAFKVLYFNTGEFSGLNNPVNADVEVVRPLCTSFTLTTPTPKVIGITIVGLTPLNQTIKDNIAANITEYFNIEHELGATVYESTLWHLINIATGVRNFTLSVPVGNTTLTASELPQLGTITYS